MLNQQCTKIKLKNIMVQDLNSIMFKNKKLS